MKQSIAENKSKVVKKSKSKYMQHLFSPYTDRCVRCDMLEEDWFITNDKCIKIITNK